MKRFWILILLAAFVTPLLTGCEANVKDEDDDDGASLKVDVDD
ncbi:MAG TPA: hypothetical protein VFB66_09670 [Tepidisphaeraceae bacterium]|nr:hypothetical protein [Tepidisphaeraceae bacterium]